MKHANLAKAREAARTLLANRDRHGTEGVVQSDVEALLRAIGVGTIESKYRIGRDEADIYLPNRRAFIEAKAHPKAADPDKAQARKDGESPRAQLDRYVTAEIENELGQLFDTEHTGTGEWTGIVTDGTHWHVYRYPHAHSAQGTHETTRRFTNEADALVAFLARTLGSKTIGKEWVPAQPGTLLDDHKAELDVLYEQLPARAQATTRTKRHLWLDMLRTSGMAPSDEAGQTRLFLAHSFLIVVVRLVGHTLEAPNETNDYRDALREGFASWVLEFERGTTWTHKVQRHVDRWDWRKRRGDVLRDLYHRYVEANDRKVFGEFYTPDWLAELMVETVLDDAWTERSVEAVIDGETDGVGVLDPACGSGTFLYHAARRILRSETVRSFGATKRADIVSSLVNGIDIHPVAVEMARVNVARALPCTPSTGRAAYRVYLGDALQTKTRDLLGHRDDELVMTTPAGAELRVPMRLAQGRSFAEDMRRMVDAAKDGKPLPKGIGHREDRQALVACHRTLTEVIQDEGNSVWAWYAVHLIGPHLLAQRKVDRIVANPPWVKLSAIQTPERKVTMENLGRMLGLQGGGKMAPHLDIASFFVLRARDIYLARTRHDAAAWLIKRSALHSGQWEPFRRRHAENLTQTVDLEALQPFGGGDATRSCILVEHARIDGTKAQAIKAHRTGRQRPKTQESLSSARRCWMWETPPARLPQGASQYDTSRIRQGATLVPHVLTMVDSQTRDAEPGWTWIRTHPSQHAPWSDVKPQSGRVPSTWIRRVWTSPGVAAYAPIRESHVLVPVDPGNRQRIHTRPEAECGLWREMEEIYEVHRGRGRGTPRTLLGQIDYMHKLSTQPVENGHDLHIVLYPSSGDIMRALRVRPGEGIADSSLFWMTTASEEEAGYLVAVLNAACLREAFAQSRESGRHFQLHPWRKVPIPRYDVCSKAHRDLAALCTQAEAIAGKVVDETHARRPGTSQEAVSRAIRAVLADSRTGQEIETLARMVLPDQTTKP